MKEYYYFFSSCTVHLKLRNEITSYDPKKCLHFYVSHILCLVCNDYRWKTWNFIGVLRSFYLYYESNIRHAKVIFLNLNIEHIHFHEPA